MTFDVHVRPSFSCTCSMERKAKSSFVNKTIGDVQPAIPIHSGMPIKPHNQESPAFIYIISDRRVQ